VSDVSCSVPEVTTETERHQPIIRFMLIQREYLRLFIRSSIEDGISHIEVRVNFFIK